MQPIPCLRDHFRPGPGRFLNHLTLFGLLALSVFFTLAPSGVSAQYCTPGFTSNTVYIDNFSLTGENSTAISSNGTGHTGYTIYGLSADVTAGSNLSGSVTYVNNFGPAGYNCSLWADWNNNQTFESGELIQNFGVGNTGTNTSTVTIPVPSNSFVGSVRLRVYTKFGSPGAPASPCDNQFAGEAEDYTLNVAAPPNSAPTDITLSNNTIAENNAVDAVIGTLSTTDPDAGNTFTYTLSGLYAPLFNINGDELRASNALNFEEASVYEITITSTDQGGLSFDETFTINVTDVNDAPEDIDLSTAEIAENNAVNAVISTISTYDPDAGNTFTYTLSGTDAASFNINNDELRASEVFDFETKSSYSIIIRTTDQGGLFYESTITINVTDVVAECAGTFTVPDANFRLFLEQNYPTVICDGKIIPAQAALVTIMNCPSKNIASLDGIQYFTALSILACDQNQLTSLDLSQNTALIGLACDNNQLTSLNVTNNTGLVNLLCQVNQLTSLDVSNNTALTVLNCNTNQLTSLNVSNNIALTELRCGQNQLTNLDISNNLALTKLVCDHNQLASLDVSNNTALQVITCSSNQLTSLDVSNNTALQGLLCDFNQLTSLNVSSNVGLTLMDCSSNLLANLDVSNNTALVFLYCYNNQLTSLDVSNNTALFELLCNKNLLTSLNLSTNAALTKLNCRLNSLNCFSGTLPNSLEEIGATMGSNNIVCLPNKPTSLTTCDVANNGNDICNGPTDISLSASSIAENNAVNDVVGSLTTTDPDAGDVFTYELSGADAASFNLNGADLRASSVFDFETKSSYDVTVTVTDKSCRTFAKNLTITVTDANEAPTNIALSVSFIDENNAVNAFIGTLSTTDPDAFNLFTYSISGTDAGAFNVSGSSLRASSVFDFETKSSYSIVVRTTDQGGLFYEETFTINVTDVNECAGTFTVPDANFRLFLEQNHANVICDGKIIESEAANVTFMDCNSNNIANLDGIQFFTALTELRCKNNLLTGLNVASNTALAKLNCRNNQLTSLNVSSNTALTDLDFSANQLTSVDLSNNTALVMLNSNNNQLTNLNLSQNTALLSLQCAENQLSGLNVSNNTALTEIICQNNLLTSLNLANNTALIALYCSSNQIASLSLSQNAALETLYCEGNQIASLNLSNNTSLVTLVCGSNQLTCFRGTLPNTLQTIAASGGSNSIFCLPNKPAGLTSCDVANNGDEICDAPTDISLSASSIAENNAVNAVIGSLTATDPDAGDAFTYELSGTDAASFNLDGADLRASAVFDFETKTSYDIIVTATDKGCRTFDKNLTIFVTDVVEAGSNGTVAFVKPTSDMILTEGNSSYQSIPIWVELTGATDFPVTVKLPYTGNASYGNTLGKDFYFTTTAPTVVTWDATGVTLTFNRNIIRKFNLIIYGDLQVEPNEDVILTLKPINPNVAISGAHDRVFTITTDDPPSYGTLTFDAATPSTSTAEGNSGNKLVPMKVTLSGANSFPVAAQISYAGSTGSFGNTFGKDFHLTGLNASNQLVFNANGTLYFNVVVMGDVVNEADELVNLTLSSPTVGAGLGSTNRTVTILNDDAPRFGEESTTTETGLSLYPNPNNGLFNLSIESKDAAAAQVNVYDLNGRLVLSRQNELVEGQNLLEFDLTAEPVGLYLLEIQTGDRRELVKVVVK